MKLFEQRQDPDGFHRQRSGQEADVQQKYQRTDFLSLPYLRAGQPHPKNPDLFTPGSRNLPYELKK
jgi:hypothetical protein